MPREKKNLFFWCSISFSFFCCSIPSISLILLFHFFNLFFFLLLLHSSFFFPSLAASFHSFPFPYLAISFSIFSSFSCHPIPSLSFLLSSCFPLLPLHLHIISLLSFLFFSSLWFPSPSSLFLLFTFLYFNPSSSLP